MGPGWSAVENNGGCCLLDHRCDYHRRPGGYRLELLITHTVAMLSLGLIDIGYSQVYPRILGNRNRLVRGLRALDLGGKLGILQHFANKLFFDAHDFPQQMACSR